MSKKNRLVLILILFIVGTIFYHPIKSVADSGWDSSYDGGGSWDSGSSWGGGCSWDYDYGRSSYSSSCGSHNSSSDNKSYF